MSVVLSSYTREFGGSNLGGFDLSLNSQTGVLTYANARYSDGYSYSTPEGLVPERWYDFAHTIEKLGSNEWRRRTYLNGALVDEKIGNYPPTNSNSPIKIGTRRWDVFVKNSVTSVDELAIWAKTLNQTDVTRLHAATQPPPPPPPPPQYTPVEAAYHEPGGLAGWWRLGDDKAWPTSDVSVPNWAEDSSGISQVDPALLGATAFLNGSDGSYADPNKRPEPNVPGALPSEDDGAIRFRQLTWSGYTSEYPQAGLSIPGGTSGAPPDVSSDLWMARRHERDFWSIGVRVRHTPGLAPSHGGNVADMSVVLSSYTRDFGGSNLGGFDLSLNSQTGVLTYANARYDNGYSYSTPEGLVPEQWYDFVHTIEKLADNEWRRRTYLDGALVDEKVGNYTPTNSNSPIKIGTRYWDVFVKNSVSSVDELAIWAKTLTPTQVLILEGAGEPLQPFPIGQSWGTSSAYGHDTSRSAADPVDTLTGAYTSHEVDLARPGLGVPFVLERSYVSADTAPTRLGAGWRDSFSARLEVEADGDVLLHGENGQEIAFARQADGTLSAPTATARLIAVPGGYELSRHDQVHLRFDATGRLESIKDRNGQGLTLRHEADKLVAVTDAGGREFTFSYVGDLISSVRAPEPDGRQVNYGYTDGQLTSVTDVRGKVWRYTYNAAGQLETEKDPNGHWVVRNTYDPSSGRVTKQLDAFDREILFGWDPATQTATMTDAAGKTWTDVYVRNALVAHSDPYGNTTSYGWDTRANAQTVTDARGNTTSMTYENGNLTSRTAPPPLSHKETWTYNAFNDVETHTDARGNVAGCDAACKARHTTTYEYDPAGNLTKVIGADPDGGGPLERPTTVYVRDPTGTGLLLSASDPRHKTTTYAYSNGDLTSITSPLGNMTTFGYDAAGRVDTVVEPRGNVPGCDCAEQYATRTVFDAAGHTLSQTDPLGHETVYTYDDVGNLLTLTRGSGTPRSQTWTYEYNEANERVRETAPGELVTQHEYDARGSLITSTSPTGRITTYTYDDAMRLETMVRPLGNKPDGVPSLHRWTYGYDENGNPTSVEDPLGNRVAHSYDVGNRKTSTTVTDESTGEVRETAFEYDLNGNVISVTGPDPDGLGPLGRAVTAYGFDSLDRLTSTTDPREKTTLYGYDAAGNRTSLTTHLGNTTTYSYDEDGHLASTVEPRGNVVGADPDTYRTRYGYDAAGHLTSVTDPLDRATTFDYDEAGRRTSRTDARQHTVGWTYDELNRLVVVTDAEDRDTTYAFDPAGNLSSRTDAKQHTTTYGYNDEHELTSVATPLGKQWTYEYDENGRLVERVDGNGNATPIDPGDGTTIYAHDSLDRLTGIAYSDATPDVTFSYNGFGERTSMLDGAGSQSYGYDGAGRLAAVTRGADTFAYAYDPAGNVTRRTYPDGTSIDYAYDDEGRLQTVTNGLDVTSYGYDAAANVISTTLPAGNGHVESRAYDPAGRLSELTNAKGASVLSQYTVDRDEVGNPTQIVQTGAVSATTGYAYDASDRLESVCFQSGAACASTDPFIRWTYDAVGNRATEERSDRTTSYSNSADDELTETSTVSTTVSYDEQAQAEGAQPYWRFGEPTGTSFASSVGSFTGTWSPAQSPPVRDVGAVSQGGDHSIVLNGTSQYGRVADASELDKTNGFSVELWVRRTKSQQTQAIVGKPLTTTTANENYAVWFDSNNRIRFEVGSGQPTNRSVRVTSAAALDTRWHHVVGTFASGVTRLYVDGALSTSATAYGFTSAGTNASALDIGRAGTTSYYGGALDELAIYGSVMSDVQVADHYRRALGRYAGQVFGDGARPYWRLGEKSGTTFASLTGSFAGTWSGSPSRGVEGALSASGDGDTAVALNGTSQYGTVSDNSQLDKTNNFSIELWVKRTKSGATQAVAGKPLTTTTRSENYAVWLDAANKVRFEVGNGTTSAAVTSGTPLDTGWHHVVGTFASGRLQLYLDGSLSASATASFTAAITNGSQLQLGRAGSSSYYGGSLDELAIYGSVLTAAQVADHYERGSTPLEVTTAYGYDENGQQVLAGARTFTWDLAGRVESTTAAGSTMSYAYDGDGTRLSATTAGATAGYVWDPNFDLPQLALERDGSGSPIRRYVYSAGGISMTSGGAESYYHYDPLGSVSNVTSATGTTQWTYAYEPFGLPRTATKNDPGAPDNPMRFTGEYADPTGLYHLRARQYDPASGRFLSTDPLAPAIDDPYVASYVYVNQRPTVLVDPSGLKGRIAWFDFSPWSEGDSASDTAHAAAQAPLQVALGGYDVVDLAVQSGVYTADPRNWDDIARTSYAFVRATCPVSSLALPAGMPGSCVNRIAERIGKDVVADVYGCLTDGGDLRGKTRQCLKSAIEVFGIGKVAKTVIALRGAGRPTAEAGTAAGAVATNLHHTVPAEILRQLPEDVANDPLVRGRAGAPNRWAIPEDLHRAIHAGPGGGAYNQAWKDALEELGREPTVGDVIRIRDELTRQFGIDAYRP